jgi:hypothetical protein
VHPHASRNGTLLASCFGRVPCGIQTCGGSIGHSCAGPQWLCRVRKSTSRCASVGRKRCERVPSTESASIIWSDCGCREATPVGEVGTGSMPKTKTNRIMYLVSYQSTLRKLPSVVVRVMLQYQKVNKETAVGDIHGPHRFTIPIVRQRVGNGDQGRQGEQNKGI